MNRQVTYDIVNGVSLSCAKSGGVAGSGITICGTAVPLANVR